MDTLIVKEVSASVAGKAVLHQLSFTIKQGEQWVITGPSGCGKTTLLKVLAGRQNHSGRVAFFKDRGVVEADKIVMVEQQHHFRNLSNTTNFYYQQRFNSYDSSDAVTVEQDLAAANTSLNAGDERLAELTALFELQKIYAEPLIQLSNGENKRLQIVKALLREPKVLLLDNPFTGLDVKSRADLEHLLKNLTKAGLLIILVTSAVHLPSFVTHGLALETGGAYRVTSINPGQSNKLVNTASLAYEIDQSLLQELAGKEPLATFDYAIRMKAVTIQYDRKILDRINWEVKRGERWSLSGPNGSGKSTLLSLVNADNPQAYANEIYLFDRKRGTGETIWQIKKRIGFVSPELHLYFDVSATVFEVVASGLFDTIGLFRKINDEQAGRVNKWLKLLRAGALGNQFLRQLSNSQQRLVLLARALVKNPPLLILDEPCQGLDPEQSARFKNLINEICVKGNKTLVYVSHYAEDVPACVTKFIQLNNGRVVG